MRPKTILSILVFFCISRQFGVAAAGGLPLIQISHDDLGEDYPEMKEEVHLEDFFWTGSGDGPPDYLKKVHTGISKGKDVIVKTETVVATVYVDGNNEIDIPICLDCPPDDGGGTINGMGGSMPPLNYSATDRRYWLLTVMSGFYTQKDNPMLEEKLARLYRLAFTRQQSRHLGLNGAQSISGISLANGRDRREHKVDSDWLHTTESVSFSDEEIMDMSTRRANKTDLGEKKLQSTTEKDPASDIEMLDMAATHVSFNKTLPSDHPLNNNSELDTSSEEVSQLVSISSTTEASTTLEESIDITAYATLIPWELIQEKGKSEKQLSTDILKQPASPEPAIQVLQPNHPLLTISNVRVVIHNITQFTEEDLQKGNAVGIYDEDVNTKIDDRPIANQTELIYSVLVDGRPVLAVTAANDMKLVSEAEVSEVIGNKIFMKAEPYLREPQATPLVPATHSGSVGFIDSLQNNPALIIVSSFAILLLLLLVIALLLMGRFRDNDRQTEVRSSSRNGLLTDTPSARPPTAGTTLTAGRSTIQSRDVGIQNFSFEHEAREPRIDFPAPPAHGGPRHDSLTSTDNTSDSSAYCPINPPTADVQRMLDQKAASLFDGHKRRHHQYDRAEGLEDLEYADVAEKKKTRHKTKRRYLSENRVGSLETSPAQRSAQRTTNSSGDEVVTDSIDDDGLQPTYENFERNEAYNRQNNYHRNKLLHQKSKSSVIKSDDIHATEAINKEVIRSVVPPYERSSDTGSIGSFLSMASVKAFPKSPLPEPLTRVLDPVFVTYYDNVENSKPTTVQPAAVKSKPRTPKGSMNATTIATIEGFPTPKAPSKSPRFASQSDNPDPGVIGPIVWERHKKRLSQDVETDNASINRRKYNYSPIRDPAAMRNHYEGLLEGAIQMYTHQDDLPMPLPTRDFTNNRKPTKRENRGSSAGVPSYSTKLYNFEGRPSTAQPQKTPQSNQSTQPPSPNTGAWGGSLHGSYSPLVRPYSADTISRPEAPQSGLYRKSSIKRTDISAAPIIEAIQNELRRFKQDDK